MNSIRDQIRQAKLVDIGNCTSAGALSFTNLGLSALQVGNAIRVTPYNDLTNSWTIIYLDTTLATSNYLKQCDFVITNHGTITTNQTTPVILASYITNSDIFTAQDYWGYTLTNEDEVDNTLQSIPNRLVIYVKLQFYQWEYPIAIVGTNGGANMYDYYQLRTKVTRRSWN